MFQLRGYRRVHNMVEIEFFGVEPPEGRVRITGPSSHEGGAVAFAGWTGLIQAIVQLVSPELSVAAADSFSSELGT